MLLHLLLIVLIGDSIRTGGRRGEGFWGSLDVTLRRMSPEPGSGVKLAPGTGTTSPGAALLRRFGGAADAPSPARVGPRPPSYPAPTREERRTEDSPQALEAPPSVQEGPSPRPAARPFEALPPVDLNAPQEIDKPITPPAVSPPVVERQASPARPPTVAPVAPPLLERVAPRTIERELAPSVELTPRETPISPAPLERVAPRQIERELAPPVELHPREVPMTLGPIERIAPARVERELAPAVELNAREAPLVPVPMERVAPAQVDRLADVPAPASTRAVEPATAPAGRAAPAERAAPGADREAAPASPAPSRERGGEPAPRLNFGTPQPDEDMFKPRRDVVVPSAEPGGLPHIDRDAARSRAREIAREGLSSRALVQVDLPLPERPTRNLFDKAAKPDCRTAYAGLGLLAIPVLLASALADTGCRW